MSTSNKDNYWNKKFKECLSIRVDIAEERISELENKSEEITQAVAYRDKKMENMRS